MLHDGQSIRVAVVGGLRIPFCRAHSVYRGCSNQDMMTTTLQAVVNKYDLKDQTLGDVALGAVIKHSKDWNLARESVIGSGLSMKTPAFDIQRNSVAIPTNRSAGSTNSCASVKTDTPSTTLNQSPWRVYRPISDGFPAP